MPGRVGQLRSELHCSPELRAGRHLTESSSQLSTGNQSCLRSLRQWYSPMFLWMMGEAWRRLRSQIQNGAYRQTELKYPMQTRFDP